MGLGDEILQSMLEDINRKLGGIEEKIGQIARLEERMASYRETMARAFAEIEILRKEVTEVNKRLADVEREEPVTHLVRDWALRGVIALVTFGVGALFAAKWGVHI